MCFHSYFVRIAINMKLYSVLVTGANRGIGLEFVKQLSTLTDGPQHLFATYRNAESRQILEAIRDDPNTTSSIHLLNLDVTKKNELEAAKKTIEDIVGDKGLTVLINNAGLLKKYTFEELTETNLGAHFSVNTVGPIITLQTMLPLLQKAASLTDGPDMNFSRAAVLNISSLAGSITYSGLEASLENCTSGYKISKAALNMGMKVAAEVVKKDNILVVNMCPGFVKTDMGMSVVDEVAEIGEKLALIIGTENKKTGIGENSAVKTPIPPEESVSQILKTINNFNESNHGTYVDRFGKVHPF